MRNAYLGNIFSGVVNVFISCQDSWISYNHLACNIKFALYIVFLVIIFTYLWKQMVTNMQMDIIKALGILNILPTHHLRSHPEFIKDMNRSSLIN